jgi:hypothetical protein
MTAHKMPPEFVDLVVRLDDVEGGRRVVTECGLTARITFPGMAQGEVLSPKKFVVSQDPLVRWLSKYGRGKKVWMKWGGEVRQVTVVSLHFCDDMVVCGQSLEDLQHNLGIISEWCRATGMKLNGEKSAYLTTDASEGMVPAHSPTLDGKWEGGCDGNFIPSTEEGPGHLRPREWDEAVRTLGVQRAVSENNSKQEDLLMAEVGKFAETVKDKQVGREGLKTLINTVLIPKIEYPLRDAQQANKGGKLIDKLDVKLRTVLKNSLGAVGSISTAYMYSEVGFGLDQLRTRLDGHWLSRLHHALL